MAIGSASDQDLAEASAPAQPAAPPDVAAGVPSDETDRVRRGWIRPVVLAGLVTVSLLLQLLLLTVLPNLGPAEHSFAGELVPQVNYLLADSLLVLPDGLDDLQYAALHTEAAGRYLLILLGLFVVYGAALTATAGKRSRALAALGFGGGAAMLLLQVLSPVLLSSDVFSYIIYGRIFALYGGDPYTQLPSQYPTDPFLSEVYWRDTASFYGPFWTLLSSLPVIIGGDQIGLTVLLFRVMTIGAALLSAALIWLSLERVAPQRATQGMILFLWNPLLVLESGLSAHNDVVMVAFVLLGIYCYLRGWRVVGVAPLVLSALVKLVSLPILPLYGLLVLRQIQSWRRRALFVAGAGVVVALTLASVVVTSRSGPAILAVGTLGSSLDRYQNNVHGLLFQDLRLRLGEASVWTDVPVQFEPWWVMTHTSTELWSSPYGSASLLGTVDQWAVGLVIAPQEGVWLRIYDTGSQQVGYIWSDTAGPLETPPAQIDETAAWLLTGPAASPAALLANSLIRLGGWVLFGVVCLLAAWRAAHLRAFLVWSTVVMLAFYWLAATWIWPWYVVWALALAALVPTSPVATLTALLSAGVLTLYVAHGYQGEVNGWIFTYRAIPAFVLPLVLFAAIQLLLLATRGIARMLRWARRMRAGAGRPTPASVEVGSS